MTAQQHAFSQATTRRAGAAQAINMQRRNLPEQRYGNKAEMQAWSGELSRLESEQETAKKEYGELSAVLIALQAERRAASNALETLSWQEGAVRVRVAELRKRLAGMKPSDAAPAQNQFQPMLNGTILTYTSAPMHGNVFARRPAISGRTDSY